LFRPGLNFSVNFDSVQLVVVSDIEWLRDIFAVAGDLKLGFLERLGYKIVRLHGADWEN
jgi:hypothetical protein